MDCSYCNECCQLFELKPSSDNASCDGTRNIILGIPFIIYSLVTGWTNLRYNESASDTHSTKSYLHCFIQFFFLLNFNEFNSWNMQLITFNIELLYWSVNFVWRMPISVLWSFRPNITCYSLFTLIGVSWHTSAYKHCLSPNKYALYSIHTFIYFINSILLPLHSP